MHNAYISASQFFVGAEIDFVSDPAVRFALSAGDQINLEWPNNRRAALVVRELSGDFVTLAVNDQGLAISISPKTSSDFGDVMTKSPGMKHHQYIVRALL
ncbi:hypothetical protein PDO_1139 [Rhizobium sp. PDO1-076]|uniref:hypothetical protein n=1 Tax=Rhizobium sp. PDO1-076 TaxID=1125979 RepID=UPI00024E38D2|nr:hypothetical protein [Rhizobium sp. PDO1-076]EHS53429.1 hypothetical protein PDO_1139 [Rhizobium sp. PDO1-076]